MILLRRLLSGGSTSVPDPTTRRASVVANYNDRASVLAPVTLLDGVSVKVLNDKLGSDGAGAGNVEGSAPVLWDNNEIVAALLREGWFCRVNLTLTKTSVGAASVEAYVDIGPDDGSSPIIIARDTEPFDKANGTVETRSFFLPLYCLDTFIANGGKIYVKATNGSFTYQNCAITFWRLG